MVPAPPGNYGTTRERIASVSFADIEAAARRLMVAGGYPSVGAVRKELKRGSTTTIAEAMRRFWKDQAALNAGNPVALTRLPPEVADAAVALWEQALRLSQQTAVIDDNAARAHLEQLRRDIDHRVRSMEARKGMGHGRARARTRARRRTRADRPLDEGTRGGSCSASSTRGAHRRSRISGRGTPATARDSHRARDCEEPGGCREEAKTKDST
jgi:hypothetical protein